MPGNIIDQFESIAPSRRILILVPTHTPGADDPRDISERAQARFIAASAAARELREKYGRGHVLMMVLGGWALHRRLPLALQHVLAATDRHQLLELADIDFIIGYGVNTVTDLHGAFAWTKENLPGISELLIVSSAGHAKRMISESSMHCYFPNIAHLESGEPRPEEEDQAWSERARQSAPHQFVAGGRASDVARFGARDALEWELKMGRWAEEHPQEFSDYLASAWDLVGRCEAANIVVHFRGAGAWRLSLNCD